MILWVITFCGHWPIRTLSDLYRVSSQTKADSFNLDEVMKSLTAGQEGE